VNLDLPSRTRELRRTAERVAREELAQHADAVDATARWPEESVRAVADAGLMGLVAPRDVGGEEQGLLGLVAVTEALAQGCPSTAMCFGMHCVGTAVIAAKATKGQRERYLRDIADGAHVTTLALSEPGSGSHLYLASTRLERDGAGYVVDGVKQFVTNAGHADSYVVTTVAENGTVDMGEFSCVVVEGDAAGVSVGDPWLGFGMRGNSSATVRLDGVRIPRDNLLGEEGDTVWYLFEVVAPFFLMGMSGTYLGIAQSALDLTVQHLRTRRFDHSGETLADVPVLQHKLADMWVAVEKCRRLVFDAARRGDESDPDAMPALFMSKADAAETAVAVTNEAMTLCGGTAYRANARLARLLRDARAGHVMSPTTDMLKGWAARSVLGLPLL
jgi:isovaleryl-CoA dehydrogenase